MLLSMYDGDKRDMPSAISCIKVTFLAHYIFKVGPKQAKQVLIIDYLK
jgi:hypothetical protein